MSTSEHWDLINRAVEVAASSIVTDRDPLNEREQLPRCTVVNVADLVS